MALPWGGDAQPQGPAHRVLVKRPLKVTQADSPLAGGETEARKKKGLPRP